MKRPALITTGIAIILLVLGVWLYLLLFGTPATNQEVFTNLGFDFKPQPVTVVTPESEAAPTIDTKDGLSQLTTRPVAGFTPIARASSSLVRYAEQGTGHIYEIDLATGEEQLVSRTTIPRVQTAHFSTAGNSVALTSILAYTKDTFVADINSVDTLLEGTNLPPNASNVDFYSPELIRYTYENGDGLSGYEYNFIQDTQRELFRLPFTQVHVDWGSTTYAVTKPADDLIGYLYKIENGTYRPTLYSGYGLIAARLGPYLARTEQTEDQLKTTYSIESTDTDYEVPVTMFPEKCTAGQSGAIWCASPLLDKSLSIDDWYKGIIISEDNLWKIDPARNQGILYQQISKTAGRPLDVTNLQVDQSESALYFINRIDNTLWRQSL